MQIIRSEEKRGFVRQDKTRYDMIWTWDEIFIFQFRLGFRGESESEICFRGGFFLGAFGVEGGGTGKEGP